MKAYLFSGCVSFFHHGQFTDGCSSSIIYGGDEESAWKAFEKGLLSPGGKEEPALTKVEKIVGAPVLEQLFTEAGHEPIDWPNINDAVAQSLENVGHEEAGQGYWVEPNECFDSGALPPSIESLQGSLTEEFRSGLNWASDKSYFFVVTVLSPQPPELEMEEWTEGDEASGDNPGDTNAERAAELSLRQRLAAFPEMAGKELAVVVRARNSVVAAWLWKKQALSTPLAQNLIRIDSWCGAIPLEADPEARAD